MPPTITDLDVEKRLARMEELSHRGRSQETKLLVDWLKAELDDVKARLDALEA